MINPCIPRYWTMFKVDYRFGATHYKISVENLYAVNQGVREILLDAVVVSGGQIPLVDDGKPHVVRVVMGN
jgi:cellobiose phosphorylase